MSKTQTSMYPPAYKLNMKRQGLTANASLSAMAIMDDHEQDLPSSKPYGLGLQTKGPTYDSYNNLPMQLNVLLQQSGSRLIPSRWESMN